MATSGNPALASSSQGSLGGPAGSSGAAASQDQTASFLQSPDTFFSKLAKAEEDFPALDARAVLIRNFSWNETLKDNRASVILLPWERGPFAWVFGHPSKRPRIPMPYDHEPVRQSGAPSAVPALKQVPDFAKKRLQIVAMMKTSDSARWEALRKFRVLVMLEPGVTELGCILLAEASLLKEDQQIARTFGDVFSGKATSTLVKRASALWSFAKWTLDSGYGNPFTAGERILYLYLQELEANARPTSGSSFLQAWNFAAGTLQFKDQAALRAVSSRVKGLALKMYQGKRRLQQAIPLTVKQVKALEYVVIHAPYCHWKVIAGHLLFCLGASARFGDSLWLGSLNVSSHQGLCLVEAESSHWKTAPVASRKSQLLPMCSLGKFFADSNWADLWMKAREDSSLGLHPALPAWSESANCWLDRPMSTGEACCYLKEFLTAAGQKIDGIGTHSLKCTVLSWAAKSTTVPLSDRRLLGHHVDPAVMSPLTYARDELTRLMKVVHDLIVLIRKGALKPDESRVWRLAQLIKNSDGSEALLERKEASGLTLGRTMTAAELDAAKDCKMHVHSRGEVVELQLYLYLYRVAVDQLKLGCCFRWDVDLRMGAMNSTLDSAAAFHARALEIGLTAEFLKLLEDGGVTTMGTLAFISPFQVGHSDEKPLIDALKTVVKRDLTQKELFVTRRLWYEASTTAMGELKQKVERNDSAEPIRLAVAERTTRIEEQRKRLNGVHFSSDSEPSYRVTDLVFQQGTDQQLIWLPWEKYTSRAQEIVSSKSDLSISFDNGGNLRLNKKFQDAQCSLTGELQVRQALQRRSLCYDLAQLCSYSVMEAYHEEMFSLLSRPPVPGRMCITMGQVKEADKVLFLKIAEETRGALSVRPDGSKPMELQLLALKAHPQVQFCVIPGRQALPPWQTHLLEVLQAPLLHRVHQGRRLIAFDLTALASASENSSSSAYRHNDAVQRILCEFVNAEAHPEFMYSTIAIFEELPVGRHREARFAAIHLTSCEHDVCQWSGHRTVLVAFSTRGVGFTNMHLQSDFDWEPDPDAAQSAAAAAQQDALVKRLLCSPVFLVHIALPCGTGSRARERPLPAHLLAAGAPQPQPLRSSQHVLGLPDLCPSDQARVTSANLLSEFTIRLLALCHERGWHVSIENPVRSWMWSVLAHFTRQLKSPALASFFNDLHTVDYAQCMLGGARDKVSRLLTSMQALCPLACECDKKHAHLPFAVARAAGRWTFATASEAEYPPQLCDAFCRLASNSLPSCPTPLPRPTVRQSRRAPQLIPEFKEFRDSRPTQGEFRELVRDGGSDGSCSTFGIFHTKQEFTHKALKLDHPFDDAAAIDDSTRRNIFDLLTKGLSSVAQKRINAIKKVNQMAKELSVEEARFQTSLPQHAQEVLKGKRILLWRKLLQETGFPDVSVSELMEGVDLVGKPTKSPLFEWKEVPATSSVQDLLDSSVWRNHALQKSPDVGDSGDLTSKLWECTMQEVDKGFLKGPFQSEEQVRAALGEEAVCCTRRFLVVQGSAENPKFRPIDDFRESGINEASRPETVFAASGGLGPLVDSGTRSQASAAITVINWNCGGFSTLKDEFYTWLRGCDCDVVCLQETWMKECSEFFAGDWLCVQSGMNATSSRAQAGVMIMLRRSVFDNGSVRYSHVMEGRLLHVRAQHKHGWVDVVGAYLHAWGGWSNEADILAKRSKVWAALRQTLGQLPRGNQLVVCGDFNTVVQPKAPFFGTGMSSNNPTPSADAQDFEAILHDFGLQAVNTFGKQGSYTHILEHHSQKTRSFLDYVLVRRKGPTLSSSARMLVTFPVARWRGGGRHLPVLVTVRFRRFQFARPRPQPAWPQWKCKLLADRIAADGPDVQDFKAQVSRELQAMHDFCPDRVNQVLMKASRDHFHIVSWPDNNFRNVLQVFELAFGLGGAEPGFTSCTKSYVVTAGSFADIALMNFYGMRHVPKQPKARAQLRSSTGAILMPQAEVQALASYWKEVTTAEDPVQAPSATTFDLEMDAVQQALASLPSNKAAPAHYAPHALWSCVAEPVSQVLERGLLQEWRSSGAHIPTAWADAWLTFLQKANKAGNKPEHLRPIALLDPVGKAVSGLLRKQLDTYILPHMEARHQYGFLPGRSVQQALGHAFIHCKSVRSLSQAQNRSLYDKFAGHQAKGCAGGMLLSIDLTQAFDRVGRDLLEQALIHIGVPLSLRSLLLRWVHSVRYVVQKEGHAQTFPTSRGIRQGCRLSPSLWNCVVVYLTHLLEQQLGVDWCRQRLIGYADDNLFKWTFHSREDVAAAISEATAIINLLEQQGLTVSKDKTAILLKLAGPQAEAYRRKIVVKHEGKHHLRLNQDLTLPVKAQHTYLGAIISFGRFEELNATHRCQAGIATYNRLRQHLHSKRTWPLAKRLRLWKAYVLPTVFYSLTASGLTEKGASCIRVALLRQLRAIAGRPRHLTLESDAQFLLNLGMPTPLQLLIDRQRNTLDRTEQLRAKLSPGDFRLDAALLAHETEVLHGLQELAADSSNTGATDDLPCPDCGERFPTAASLRQHRAKVHRSGENKAKGESFDRLLHGKDGLPQCINCGHKFGTWEELQRHVQLGRCQAPERAGYDDVHPPLLAKVLADEIVFPEVMLNPPNDDLKKELLERCALCRQWLPNENYMKVHYGRVHKDEWKAHSSRLRVWCTNNLAPIKGTCQWCGHKAQQGPKDDADMTAPSDEPYPSAEEVKPMLGMTYDAEIQDVFANCLPALANLKAGSLEEVPERETEDLDMPNRGKRSRPEPMGDKTLHRSQLGKGKGGQRGSDAKNRGSWNNWERDDWDYHSWRPQHRADLERLMEALCRLTLKQEEELQLLRTEKQFLLHLESGPQGMLTPLWKVAQVWKAGKDKTPPTVTSSLRVALIKCVLAEWMARLDIMTKDAETVKKMEAQGWVKVQGVDELHWNFQQWNQQTRQLELDPSKPPVGHSTILRAATNLQALVNSETERLIHRFHSTRKLTELVMGDTMPFILSVAMRGTKAQQAHDILSDLTGSAALRTVGVRIRGERVNLQPLAQQIAKMAAALRR
ncbi:unnamed protein product [Symbiodinium sp. CCMP2592]|nr:unnamed protein product [Symbiodinium sp. CCMP2592]